MISQATNPSDAAPTLSIHPYLGVAGVLLGAMIVTCTGRLMSVGLADIRGALRLGVDEASWINTSFNASMMFIGPFSVYLGGLLGPRRVLLACAWIFTIVSFTLAISDSFLLIAMCCVVCLVIVAFMSTVPTQYRQIIASIPEAK
jgi:MFS transporter, DHA2 family, multidrug resistance protein